MTQFEDSDIPFMRRTLLLAQDMLGSVWPNPAVGCVLTKAGMIIGEGVTGQGGRPHAERVALDMAGDQAKGATAYVSLEPCSHHGKTPPCANALIDAGIKRVVIAVEDPDPRVSGDGIKALEAAGIDVVVGLMANEARVVNKGFFVAKRAGRPLVCLKVATSLDGRIATKSGESQWITGEDARSHVHAVRASMDAILVGVGTVLADDPMLTCRVEGLEDASPVRVILDTHLKTPLESKLVQTANDVPTWIVTTKPDGGEFEALGVKVITVADTRDVTAVLKALADEGLTRLMVEGGGKVLTSFLTSGHADELLWYRAPVIIGGDGISVFDALGKATLNDTPRFSPVKVLDLGQDKLEIFSAKD